MLMRIFSRTCLILFVLFLSSTIYGASQDPVRAKNGMVVSANEIASQVGVEILKKGGNAVDAAVAVGFALAVVHPTAGNLGGGGFMVIHLKDGTNTTIDFREKAPYNAHKNMYLDADGNLIDTLSYMSLSSSGVPGSVAGLLYVLEKYGSMSLADVISPAIDLAANGFVIGYQLAESINKHHDEFLKYSSSSDIFTNNGLLLDDDYELIQTDLAKTLTLIKQYGVDGFYKGKVADLIVAQSIKNGGLITHEDLEDYRPIERDPVLGMYKGKKVVTMGLPSAGGTNIVQILNVLSNCTITPDMWGSSQYIHLMTEIFKYIFADRSKYFGDKDFYDVPTEWLLSSEYTEYILSKLSNRDVPSSEIQPSKLPQYESKQTIHYCVMDNQGNAVSTTTTLNSSYGNKIVVEGAGFIMNNEMNDFAAQPGMPNLYGLVGSEANSIQPGKRMLSSMSPTIVLDDNEPYLVVGGLGGSMIMTSVLQVILNCMDFDMNIQEAIDAPRFHHQWLPDSLSYEKFTLSNDVKDNLIKMGHVIGKIEPIARVEGIMVDKQNKLIWGASDPRGYGKAVGY